ncbi:hypothetical protein KBT16_21960 [Nostoc sp. CCCryo 231-06]|nr:hypothetical protein [Nostoc sp. CCCryo 231-06]
MYIVWADKLWALLDASLLFLYNRRSDAYGGKLRHTTSIAKVRHRTAELQII